jgi:hypothetical protein
MVFREVVYAIINCEELAWCRLYRDNDEFLASIVGRNFFKV